MGATSGIGREVTILLARAGYTIGIAARRADLLEQLHSMFPQQIYTQVIDVNSPDAPQQLLQLIHNMGGIDTYLHSTGIGKQNPQLDVDTERLTMLTNACGFTTMVDTVFNYFSSQGIPGHIAVISSVAGTKGIGVAPAYAATKRMQWTYIEALSQLAHIRHLPITFSDIRPGFVDTPLLDNTHFPMTMQPTYVARRIVSAMQHRRRLMIIDWRYRLVCFLWQLIPSWLWQRLTFIQ